MKENKDDLPKLKDYFNGVVRLKAERQGGKWKEYYDNQLLAEIEHLFATSFNMDGQVVYFPVRHHSLPVRCICNVQSTVSVRN